MTLETADRPGFVIIHSPQVFFWLNFSKPKHKIVIPKCFQQGRAQELDQGWGGGVKHPWK